MNRIVVDCFGGDRSPAANVCGAISAANENKNISLILVGKENEIREEYQKQKELGSAYRLPSGRWKVFLAAARLPMAFC